MGSSHWSSANVLQNAFHCDWNRTCDQLRYRFSYNYLCIVVSVERTEEGSCGGNRACVSAENGTHFLMKGLSDRV